MKSTHREKMNETQILTQVHKKRKQIIFDTYVSFSIPNTDFQDFEMYLNKYSVVIVVVLVYIMSKPNREEKKPRQKTTDDENKKFEDRIRLF